MKEIVLLLIFLVFLSVDLQVKVHKMEDSLERITHMEMYNQKIKDKMSVSGLYYGNGFFCAWTDGRTESQINTTIAHEYCHDFVKKNRVHFCG